jgi:hypothetical protein
MQRTFLHEARRDGDSALIRLNHALDEDSLNGSQGWCDDVYVLDFGFQAMTLFEFYGFVANINSNGPGFVRIYLGSGTKISYEFVKWLAEKFQFSKLMGVQFYLFEGCRFQVKLIETLLAYLPVGRVDFIIPGREFHIVHPRYEPISYEPPTAQDLEDVRAVFFRQDLGHSLHLVMSHELLLPVWPTPQNIQGAVHFLQLLFRRKKIASLTSVELRQTSGRYDVMMQFNGRRFVWTHDPFRFPESTRAICLMAQHYDTRWTLRVQAQGEAMSMLLGMFDDVLEEGSASDHSGPRLELTTERDPIHVVLTDRLMDVVQSPRLNLFYEEMGPVSSMDKQAELCRLDIKPNRRYSVAEWIRLLLNETLSGIERGVAMQYILRTLPYTLLHGRVHSYPNRIPEIPDEMSWPDLCHLAMGTYGVDIDDALPALFDRPEEYVTHAQGLCKGRFHVTENNLSIRPHAKYEEPGPEVPSSRHMTFA